MKPNMGTARAILAGGRLWTPRDLSTSLALWLDAADSSSMTLSGSNITQWNDKSLFGNHVLQSTTNKKPNYTFGVPGTASPPKVVFSTTNSQVLNSAANAVMPVGTTNRILFSVWSTTLVATGTNGIMTYGDRVSATTGTSLGLFYSSSRDIWISINNVDGYESVNTNTSQIYLESYIMAAQTINIRKYGTSVGTGAFAFNTGAGILSVGNSNWINSTVNPSNATIYELICVQSDGTNYAVVEGYLAWKWGLQAQLPATHPYALSPPLVPA